MWQTDRCNCYIGIALCISVLCWCVIKTAATVGFFTFSAFIIIRLTFWQSRPNKAGLKFYPSVCPSGRTYVRTCVRPSVRASTKSFFDFNEIWRVGRGQWVVHDGVQYDSIQGQGHEPFQVGNPAIFRNYLLPPFRMGTGNWSLILKLGHNI